MLPKNITSQEIARMVPTGGFGSFGHFALAVKLGQPESRKTSSFFLNENPQALEALADWREIQQKAPSGLFETSDPDGGLLVPTEFANTIYIRARGANQILNYLKPMPLRNRQIKIPALVENSRADGSRLGGVRSFWAREAAQYSRTKPQYRDIGLDLSKLTIEIVVTEELLEDVDGLADHLSEVASEEFNFTINNAVINGSGAGVPRGLLTSGSKITVAAVTGQGANTLIAQNVLDMWSRVTPSQRNSVVWLMNQDAESSLLRGFNATGQFSNNTIITYDDDGNLRLCGRPAIVLEQCSTVGTEGDIMGFR
jgi:HK97 family phage major capsid protein